MILQLNRCAIGCSFRSQALTVWRYDRSKFFSFLYQKYIFKKWHIGWMNFKFFFGFLSILATVRIRQQIQYLANAGFPYYLNRSSGAMGPTIFPQSCSSQPLDEDPSPGVHPATGTPWKDFWPNWRVHGTKHCQVEFFRRRTFKLFQWTFIHPFFRPFLRNTLGNKKPKISGFWNFSCVFSG